MKFALLIFLSVIPLLSHGQEYTQSHLDSLEDEALLTAFNKVTHDSIIAEKIARTYLNRGRREGDTIKMARGYDRLARIFHPEKNIAFADSIIELTKDLDHITYPAHGYIIKGFELSGINQIEEAYKNYLLGLKFAIINKNKPHEVYVLDRLIYSQLIWGNKKKALVMQKKRHEIISRADYFELLKKSSRTGYLKELDNLIVEEKLRSYQNFVACYLKLGEYQKAREYIGYLKDEIKTYHAYFASKHADWIIDAEMEIEYFDGNYVKSIELAETILTDTSEGDTAYKKKNASLFAGLSYLKLKNYDLSLKNLLIADSLYELDKNRSIVHYDRLLFNGLLVNYKIKKNLISQVKYLDRIISLDSIIKKNLYYFEPMHINKYETPLLLKEKEDLILQMGKENRAIKNSSMVFAIGLFLSIILLSYFVYIKWVYKKRFEAIQSIKKQNIGETIGLVKGLDISPAIVEDVIYKLQRFEERKEFLNSNLTLHSLAKKLQTNSNYLSRIVNAKKNISFSNYLHGLRVEHGLKQLQGNSTFRKFTIKAIAKECGYNSAASFSKAFYREYGVYPSYYIKRIQESK